MPVTRRIYVSLPADPWLSNNMNRLKWGIVEEIEKLGYVPEIFTDPRGKPGLAAAKSWHPRDADEIARRCVGAAVLGMPRWEFKDSDGQSVLLPTEFNHYEGALARTLGLPTMVLAHRDVRRRVVLDMNFGGYVGEFFHRRPASSGSIPMNFACPSIIGRRSSINEGTSFLGYSSASEATASGRQAIPAQPWYQCVGLADRLYPGSHDPEPDRTSGRAVNRRDFSFHQG